MSQVKFPRMQPNLMDRMRLPAKGPLGGRKDHSLGANYAYDLSCDSGKPPARADDRRTASSAKPKKKAMTIVGRVAAKVADIQDLNIGSHSESFTVFVISLESKRPDKQPGKLVKSATLILRQDSVCRSIFSTTRFAIDFASSAILVVTKT